MEPQTTARHDPEALGAPLLARLVAASVDGVAVLDEDGRYAYVNPAACEILGRNESALLAPWRAR